LRARISGLLREARRTPPEASGDDRAFPLAFELARDRQQEQCDDHAGPGEESEQVGADDLSAYLVYGLVTAAAWRRA
jgi:hypothetical protein